MADTYNSVMKGVIAALKGNTPLTNIVSTRIYSDVPQKETFPYLVVSIDTDAYDSKTFDGCEHTVTIQGFSRAKTPQQVGNIRGRVYDVLHNNTASLTLDNGTVTNVLYTNGTAFKEPDGKTWQGVSQFRIVVT